MTARLPVGLFLILMLFLGGAAQMLAPGNQEFTLSKLVVKPEANKSGNIVSLIVSPAPNLTRDSLGMCFFIAAKEGSESTLGNLVVGGGDFNWSPAQNNQREYWSARVKDKDGSYLGPLTIQKISPEQFKKATLELRLSEVQSVGNFGMPTPFPTEGKIQIALVRVRWSAKEREGLAKGAPMFLIVSNVLTIQRPARP